MEYINFSPVLDKLLDHNKDNRAYIYPQIKLFGIFGHLFAQELTIHIISCLIFNFAKLSPRRPVYVFYDFCARKFRGQYSLYNLSPASVDSYAYDKICWLGFYLISLI